MATKSTTKSPARKAATTARKPTTAGPSRGGPAKSLPQKAAAPGKAKESKPKTVEKPARGTAATVTEKTAAVGQAEARPSAAEKSHEKPKPSKMETVSLIDKPKAKAADGAPKVRTTILPPISKLVAKPGLTTPPPGPADVSPA